MVLFNFKQMESVNRDSVMSTKDWLITLLILVVPIVNLIMILVWAFSDDTNKNKQNLMKAYLIIFGVFFGVFALLGILGVILSGVLI